MDVVVHGPFAYRVKPGGTLAKGQATGGHRHKFTHTTILYSGAVHVKCMLHDGSVQEGEFRADPVRARFPKIVIFANNEHEFTALEDGTYMECWFVHRDQNNQVAEKFAGNLEATW